MCTLFLVSPPGSRSGFALSPGYSSCRDNTQDKFRKGGLYHLSSWLAKVLTLLPLGGSDLAPLPPGW